MKKFAILFVVTVLIFFSDSASATVEPYFVDCKKDLKCLLNHVKNCTPAKATITSKWVPYFDKIADQNFTSTYAIIEKNNKNCRFSISWERAKVKLTKKGMEEAKKVGLDKGNFYYLETMLRGIGTYEGKRQFCAGKSEEVQKLIRSTFEKGPQKISPKFSCNNATVSDNPSVAARDTKRLTDLKSIQTALELYYTDHNSYPAGKDIRLGSATSACLGNVGWSPLVGCTQSSSPTYMNTPIGPSPKEFYVYNSASSTSTYTVTAKLESAINGLSGEIRVTPGGIEKIPPAYSPQPLVPYKSPQPIEPYKTSDM